MTRPADVVSAVAPPVDDLSTLRDAAGRWRTAAEYWHRECLAARDAISHLMRECEDANACSDGRLNTTRIQEVIDSHGIPPTTDSENDPNNYCDPTAVHALTAGATAQTPPKDQS